MEQNVQDDVLKEQFLKGAYQPASSVQQNIEEGIQLIRVLTEHETFLNILRQELRGEQLYQDEKGERYWMQTDKPTFVQLDGNGKPLKRQNSRTGREEFVCNEDAINSVLQTLKMCGLNPVTPLTSIKEEEIRDDLLEMESKIAVLLTIKRRVWGIDKAEYPMVVGNLKVLIKDARYRAVNGTIIRALRTITSRIEQTSEHNRDPTIKEKITSPLK